MGRTVIKINAVNLASRHIVTAKNSVRSAKTSFNQTKGGVDNKIKNRSNISGRMNSISTQFTSLESKLSRIMTTVQSSVNRYTNTDVRIESMKRNMIGNVGVKIASHGMGYWSSFFDSKDKEEINKHDVPAGEGGYGGEFRDGDEEDRNKLFEDSVYSAGVASTGSIAGMDVSGKAEVDALGASVTAEKSAEWDITEKNAKIGTSIKAEVYGVKGEAEGNIGYLNGKVSGTVGKVGATGEVGISLYEDGKLSPAITAELKVEAKAAEGEAEAKIGSEEHNVHVNAKGSFLGAEAGLEVGAGKITYTDDDGKQISAIGVKAEAGAEAYVAEGTVSGGFTLFGIEVDVGVTGKAGGAGAKAGGRVTTGGASGEVGLGLGLGVGVKIDIDWSNFKLW